MKRSGISARTRNVATTTAAVALLLYLWDWLLATWLSLAVSPFREALADLLLALVFALLFETRARRASIPGGAAFGFLAGALAYLPPAIVGAEDPASFATRTLPGVTVLTLA